MRYYLDDLENSLYFDFIDRKVQFLDTVVLFCVIKKENKNISFNVFIKKMAGQFFTSLDGIKWRKQLYNYSDSLVLINQEFKIFAGYRPQANSEDMEGGLYTKMPGKVVKVLVKEGDQIEKGQTLMILEAMKMENEIKSHTAGTIKKIFVSEGQSVVANFVLLSMLD